jgi:hypothetical protein
VQHQQVAQEGEEEGDVWVGDEVEGVGLDAAEAPVPQLPEMAAAAVAAVGGGAPAASTGSIGGRWVPTPGTSAVSAAQQLQGLQQQDGQEVQSFFVAPLQSIDSDDDFGWMDELFGFLDSPPPSEGATGGV